MITLFLAVARGTSARGQRELSQPVSFLLGSFSASGKLLFSCERRTADPRHARRRSPSPTFARVLCVRVTWGPIFRAVTRRQVLLVTVRVQRKRLRCGVHDSRARSSNRCARPLPAEHFHCALGYNQRIFVRACEAVGYFGSRGVLCPNPDVPFWRVPRAAVKKKGQRTRKKTAAA